MAGEAAAYDPAILIAVDPNGVEFALPADAPGQVTGLEQVNASVCPTFTDAIMRYAERHGVPLRGTRLYLSVAGTMRAGTVRTTNGRWFISLSGLAGLTGIEPRVVNDVTAMALGTLDDPLTVPFGRFAANADPKAQRHAIIYAGAGLGAACVDRRGGLLKIVDSEVGHTPFAPTTDAEWQLTNRVRAAHGWASHEQMMQELGATPDRPGSETTQLLAAVLGRYAATVVMTFGAWDRVYLCGPVFDRLVRADKADAFRAAFEGGSKMRTLLRDIPTLVMPNALEPIRGLSILRTSGHSGLWQ